MFNSFPSLALASALALSFATPSSATEHLQDGFERADVRTSSCDGFQTWWTKYPYSLEGNPATGRVWVELTAAEISAITGGTATGTVEVETHVLSESEAAFFAEQYSASGAAGVPAIVSIVGNLVPAGGAAVGGGLTLMDWLLRNSSTTSTAGEVAALVSSGGSIVRAFSIWERGEGHRWFTISSSFHTTVNGQPRAYVLCTASYPLKET